MKLESILLLAGVALVAYMLLKRQAVPVAQTTARVSDYNGVNLGNSAIENLAYYYRDGA